MQSPYALKLRNACFAIRASTSTIMKSSAPLANGSKMAGSSSIRLNPLGIAVAAVLGCLVLWVLGIPHYFLGSSTEEVSLRELLSAGIDVSQRGGEIVKRIRLGKEADMNAESKGKTLEGANEMKTEGDMQSHIAMMYALRRGFSDLGVKLLPEYGVVYANNTYQSQEIVSEEHETQSVDISKIEFPNKMKEEVTKLTTDMKVPMKDVTVWIDPLDATQEYTEDLRQYVTTMMCVAVKGKPVIGVIHLAFSGETYWGFVDHGYSPNLKPAAERQKAESDPYQIIVSRSHAGSVEDVVKKSLGDNTKVIPAGGAGYKTLQVIKGEADAYVHVTRIKKWDICAGNAILKAVGGQLTTLMGGEVDYSMQGDPKNDAGLLATTHEHQKFLNIFQPEYEKMKQSQHK